MRSAVSSIERVIARCLSTHREIQAAYLFGSVATGRDRAGSDLDVAVLIAPSPRKTRATAYCLALMTELGATLHRSDVEVVVLNDASPLLAHRVLSRGRLAFERSSTSAIT